MAAIFRAVLLLVVGLCILGGRAQTCVETDPSVDYSSNNQVYTLTYQVVIPANSSNGTSTDTLINKTLACTCPGDSVVNSLKNGCACSDANARFTGMNCVCTGSYVKSGSSCITCTYPCVNCVASEDCLICAEGYLPKTSPNKCTAAPLDVRGSLTVGGKVFECPAGCTGCTSVTACSGCSNGYFLSGTECIPCASAGSKCKTCTSSGCSSCFNGFQISGANCVACEVNCLTCTSSSCTSCSPGYAPSGTGCAKCIDTSCKSCPSSPGICTACKEGFALFDGTCFECIQGCTWCAVATLGTCNGCGMAYYTDNGACVPCKIGCSGCSSANVCTACSEGYQLSGRECVKACIFPCQTCSPNNPISCNTCYGGYVKSGTRCVESTSCSDTLTCTSCPRKFYLKNSQCLDCSITNCINCRDNSGTVQCTRCGPGYALSDSFACQKCPSECSTCSSLEQCTTCADGYFLQKIDGVSTGQCKVCLADAKCKTCSGESFFCTSCVDGYLLDDNKCISTNYLDYKFKLDVDPGQFYTSSNSFKEILLKMSGAGSNPFGIFIKKIVKGSTDVDGSINADSPEAVASMESTLTANLEAGGGSLGGLPVTSSTIASVSVEETSTPTNTATKASTGLIVGLSVSIGLLIIAVAVVSVIKGSKADQREKLYIDDEAGISNKDMIYE